MDKLFKVIAKILEFTSYTIVLFFMCVFGVLIVNKTLPLDDSITVVALIFIVSAMLGWEFRDIDMLEKY